MNRHTGCTACTIAMVVIECGKKAFLLLLLSLLLLIATGLFGLVRYATPTVALPNTHKNYAASGRRRKRQPKTRAAHAIDLWTEDRISAHVVEFNLYAILIYWSDIIRYECGPKSYFTIQHQSLCACVACIRWDCVKREKWQNSHSAHMPFRRWNLLICIHKCCYYLVQCGTLGCC